MSDAQFRNYVQVVNVVIGLTFLGRGVTLMFEG